MGSRTPETSALGGKLEVQNTMTALIIILFTSYSVYNLFLFWFTF